MSTRLSLSHASSIHTSMVRQGRAAQKHNTKKTQHKKFFHNNLTYSPSLAGKGRNDVHVVPCLREDRKGKSIYMQIYRVFKRLRIKQTCSNKIVLYNFENNPREIQSCYCSEWSRASDAQSNFLPKSI